jgi:hypothetical protein
MEIESTPKDICRVITYLVPKMCLRIQLLLLQLCVFLHGIDSHMPLDGQFEVFEPQPANFAVSIKTLYGVLHFRHPLGSPIMKVYCCIDYLFPQHEGDLL